MPLVQGRRIIRKPLLRFDEFVEFRTALLLFASSYLGTDMHDSRKLEADGGANSQPEAGMASTKCIAKSRPFMLTRPLHLS